MAEGVAGLTRDKTRKPGKPPLPAAIVQPVVDLALGPPPGEATLGHCTLVAGFQSLAQNKQAGSLAGTGSMPLRH
jgi:hypothetical protein